MWQLRVGTRRSRLAKTQTIEIIKQLTSVYPKLEIDIQEFTTIGDQTFGSLPTTSPGVFTSTLEQALIGGEIDFVVHSLKDLPTDGSQELMVAAIPKRRSAYDVLVTADGVYLDQLPTGAAVGTSSLRRTAQLLSVRPDLNIELLRGNVDTRVEKVLNGKLTATILAEAGLQRLKISSAFLQRVPLHVMLPAPAQGALAVQCRKLDTSTAERLKIIDCPNTRDATTAERTFLASTGGGCLVPIAAYAEHRDHHIHLRAEIFSTDGCQKISVSNTGSNPTKLGHKLAQKAIEKGANKLLHRE